MTLYSLEVEFAYVRNNQANLREIFGEDHIAVYRNVVVASGRDELDLLRNLDQFAPTPPLLLGTINSITNAPQREEGYKIDLEKALEEPLS